MYIFNNTFCVNSAQKELFLRWLKDDYLRKMTESGEFSSPVVAKVLTDEMVSDFSVSVQLRTVATDSIAKWENKFENDFAKYLSRQFGTDVLSFSTVMEIL